MIVQTVTLNQIVAASTTAYTPEISLNRSHTPSEVVFQIEGQGANTTCNIEGRLHLTAAYTDLTPTPTLSTGVDGIYKVPLCSQYRVKIANADLVLSVTLKIYMGN